MKKEKVVGFTAVPLYSITNYYFYNRQSRHAHSDTSINVFIGQCHVLSVSAFYT